MYASNIKGRAAERAKKQRQSLPSNSTNKLIAKTQNHGLVSLLYHPCLWLVTERSGIKID